MTSIVLKDLADTLNLQADDPEERFISSGVSWQQYEALLAKLGDRPWYRVTYLEGMLEIMAPSRRHESYKENITRLLNAYFEETRTRFYGLGSTTFRAALKARGVEPDTCFCVGSEKAVPDLAVEVVETSGGINKLEVYRGLGVPEVWFWQQGRFDVYCLCDENYEPATTSMLLPTLDLNQLGSYVTSAEPLDAVLEFRAKMRSQLQ